MKLKEACCAYTRSCLATGENSTTQLRIVHNMDCVTSPPSMQELCTRRAIWLGLVPSVINTSFTKKTQLPQLYVVSPARLSHSGTGGSGTLLIVLADSGLSVYTQYAM